MLNDLFKKLKNGAEATLETVKMLQDTICSESDHKIIWSASLCLVYANRDLSFDRFLNDFTEKVSKNEFIKLNLIKAQVFKSKLLSPSVVEMVFQLCKSTNIEIRAFSIGTLAEMLTRWATAATRTTTSEDPMISSHIGRMCNLVQLFCNDQNRSVRKEAINLSDCLVDFLITNNEIEMAKIILNDLLDLIEKRIISIEDYRLVFVQKLLKVPKIDFQTARFSKILNELIEKTSIQMNLSFFSEFLVAVLSRIEMKEFNIWQKLCSNPALWTDLNKISGCFIRKIISVNDSRISALQFSKSMDSLYKNVIMSLVLAQKNCSALLSIDEYQQMLRKCCEFTLSIDSPSLITTGLELALKMKDPSFSIDILLYRMFTEDFNEIDHTKIMALVDKIVKKSSKSNEWSRFIIDNMDPRISAQSQKFVFAFLMVLQKNQQIESDLILDFLIDYQFKCPWTVVRSTISEMIYKASSQQKSRIKSKALEFVSGYSCLNRIIAADLWFLLFKLSEPEQIDILNLILNGITSELELLSLDFVHSIRKKSPVHGYLMSLNAVIDLAKHEWLDLPVISNLLIKTIRINKDFFNTVKCYMQADVIDYDDDVLDVDQLDDRHLAAFQSISWRNIQISFQIIEKIVKLMVSSGDTNYFELVTTICIEACETCKDVHHWGVATWTHQILENICRTLNSTSHFKRIPIILLEKYKVIEYEYDRHDHRYTGSARIILAVVNSQNNPKLLYNQIVQSFRKLLKNSDSEKINALNTLNWLLLDQRLGYLAQMDQVLTDSLSGLLSRSRRVESAACIYFVSFLKKYFTNRIQKNSAETLIEFHEKFPTCLQSMNSLCVIAKPTSFLSSSILCMSYLISRLAKLRKPLENWSIVQSFYVSSLFSPILKLRELSAQCLVRLFTIEELEKLLKGWDSRTKLNEVDGIDRLLRCIFDQSDLLTELEILSLDEQKIDLIKSLDPLKTMKSSVKLVFDLFLDDIIQIRVAIHERFFGDQCHLFSIKRLFEWLNQIELDDAVLNEMRDYLQNFQFKSPYFCSIEFHRHLSEFLTNK